MELHPTLVDDGDLDTPFRTVAISCKYRAPEPLTIQFYYEGQKIEPPKYYNESRIVKGSWTAEHEWTTTWDMRHHGHIVECHTVNRYGSTLGMLTSSLPEPGIRPTLCSHPHVCYCHECFQRPVHRYLSV